MIKLRPEFRFSSQIWPILLGVRPYKLDVGPNGVEQGGDGWTDVCMDVQIPPVFYRTSSPSGPLSKKKHF